MHSLFLDFYASALGRFFLELSLIWGTGRKEEIIGNIGDGFPTI